MASCYTGRHFPPTQQAALEYYLPFILEDLENLTQPKWVGILRTPQSPLPVLPWDPAGGGGRHHRANYSLWCHVYLFESFLPGGLS